MTRGTDCNGICSRLEHHRRPTYSKGDRFCTQCEVAFVTEDKNCKCCNRQLRGIPHRSDLKRKLLEDRNKSWWSLHKNDPEYKKNRKVYQRKYYLAHKQQLLEYRRKYNEANRETLRKHTRNYQKRHREELNWKMRARTLKKRVEKLLVTKPESVEWELQEIINKVRNLEPIPIPILMPS